VPVLNPRSARALYRQLADELRDLVAATQPGDYLPSESEIGHHYGVGRETVRRALRLLRAEGLVETGLGYRSRVRIPPQRETVRVPRGATVICRPARGEEREDPELDLAPDEWVVEIRSERMIRRYPADRVMLAWS